MKSFRFLAVFIIVYSVSQGAIAQVSNLHTVTGEPLRLMKYDKIQGTPYLGSAAWQEGTLVDKDGTVFKDVTMRYNAFDDELEVKQNGNTLIVNRKTIGSFQFNAIDDFGNTTSYIFRNGFKGSEGFDEYSNFRVIYESEKLKILERVMKIQIRVTPAAYGESDYQKFVESNEIFLIVDNKWEKTKVNQKALVNAFPQLKSQIKDYVKSNDLNLAKEWALVELCEFIATSSK